MIVQLGSNCLGEESVRSSVGPARALPSHWLRRSRRESRRGGGGGGGGGCSSPDREVIIGRRRARVTGAWNREGGKSCYGLANAS